MRRKGVVARLRVQGSLKPRWPRKTEQLKNATHEPIRGSETCHSAVNLDCSDCDFWQDAIMRRIYTQVLSNITCDTDWGLDACELECRKNQSLAPACLFHPTCQTVFVSEIKGITDHFQSVLQYIQYTVYIKIFRYL